MHRTVRALLSAAAAALSATTVLVAVAGSPAQAQTYGSLPLSAWSYTDKAQPSTPEPSPSGNYLIGSSTDAAGVKHTGRAYFTFDLTPLKGQVLHRVTFYTYERSVNDCSQVAPIEVWRTKPVASTTTWQNPPKELELLDQVSYGKGVICPGAYLGVDMIPAVQTALAAGQKSLTVEVRINAGSEAGTSVGRTMSPGVMSYGANHAPTVSGLKLTYPDAGCGTLDKHPSAGSWMQATATAEDADPNDNPHLTYAYWPVDQPDQRKQTGSGSFDLTGLADGTVVAWTAQAADYDDAGPWGKTCYFTVDMTAPATTPLVSSKKYPSNDYPGTGGPGVPGTFVFDGASDPDITGFAWSPEDGGLLQHVTTNHPGGRAKVSITPPRWGSNRLQVAPMDKAGNRGAFVEYQYQVRNSAPFAQFEMNGVGLTSHIRLSTQASDTTTFGYAVDGGPETKVPAVNGQATGDLVFDSTGTRTVVSHTYAGKKLLGAETDQVSVTDAPKVSSADFDWPASPVAGVTGTFTFTPRSVGVVSYLYDFGDGDQKQIDAGADGTAVLTWTPQDGGYYDLTVYSVDGSGNRSLATEEQFSVIDSHPGVYANSYGSHLGDPITVNAWSNLPNAVAMVYTFDGGPEQTVDGSFVFFDVVPTHTGDSVVSVRAKLDDGTLTPATDYPIHIDTAPQITTKGPFGADLVAGRTATITFTAAIDAASFRYDLGDGNGDQSVAAGADGTATITYDVPVGVSGVIVRVTSVNADGAASDENDGYLTVADPTVQVDNPWPDYGDPAGGVGVPGQFGFYNWDLTTETTKYVWHVNDGPVQEIAPDPASWEQLATYTPDHTGDNTLYVQREFTDGSLSPMTTVSFKVGTHPLITSDVYPSDAWSGGPGQQGVFTFSGGMPGIVSYTYQVLDGNGVDAATGSVDASADGSAQVTFTPSAGNTIYTFQVTGHTADGAATAQAAYRLLVGDN